MASTIRLTEFSHGAGCGCKIAPNVLATILEGGAGGFADPRLVVGHETRDDAAVYALGDGTGIISTTDFFMPIVDDPVDFGRIAATNAISDVYAMGGRPLLAIAVLGWPVQKLDPGIAGQVVAGGREACARAGIALAGGHSIDTPEPIFGLAVTGIVPLTNLKRNSTATPGARLYLTKPLGTGILATAQKQGRISAAHLRLACDCMCALNDIGVALGGLPGVTAMTDVTGFGLAGHLLEVCEGSGVGARLWMARLPVLDGVIAYQAQGCIPGGTMRNFASYGHKLAPLTEAQQQILCDPQTSGGLLVAVAADGDAEFSAVAAAHGLRLQAIGEIVVRGPGAVIELA